MRTETEKTLLILIKTKSSYCEKTCFIKFLGYSANSYYQCFKTTIGLCTVAEVAQNGLF